MVLSFKTGQWTSRTSTGTDIVTGVGFTPKIILVFSAYNSTDNAYAGAFDFMFGAAADTTQANQRCFDAFSRDAGTANYCEDVWQNGVVTQDASGAAGTIGYVSAISADGFTVNYTAKIATAHIFHYICIGGADITNTKAGAITSPANGVTGNQVTTGIGFQPDFLILWSTGQADSNIAFFTTWGLGFAKSSVEQACLSGTSKDGSNPTDTARYQRGDNSKCFALVNSTTTTSLSLQGSLVSMNADGWTINWDTVASLGATKKIGYIAIKGGSFAIDTITSPVAGTPPVSQATVNVGFTPKGLLVAGVGGTSQAGIQLNNRVSFGGGSSVTDRRHVWCGDKDANTGSAIVAKIQQNAKICKVATENATHTSTTTQAEADLASLDSTNNGGFTLSWSTIDGSNAYEFIAVALGDGVAVSATKNFQVSKGWFYSDN